ncbi:secreted phosphoprotein 24-like [Chiloscyllium plagiosum]|uniref:secreted phosphoprotein 24-like n=1 Tax=Chiloscyllium plagiosum TaxID=36176 RepID=UPI001CB7E7C4|nr:secreted phosphoprotein 24-like [Chiloscyllium plagiosum]
MKAFLLTIAAVQILHCSGIPRPKDALRASVIKLNQITETSNLCGITRRRVKDIHRTGKLSYNVDLTFSVKETVCSKNSGLEFDDPSCNFRPRKAAEKGFCKSRIEYYADEVINVDVECQGLKTFDRKSGSFESSENSVEVKTNSKGKEMKKSSKVKNKSTETSLEDSLDVESKSTEMSREDSLNVDSKSTEISFEMSSNEHHDDSRARH